MQPPTIALLPSVLLALPILAGISGRAARRKTPKRSRSAPGQTSSDPKGKDPQPPHLPPDKGSRDNRLPPEVHLSVEVPPGTRVRVTVGTADRRRGATTGKYEQVFNVPGEEPPPTAFPGEEAESQRRLAGPPDRLSAWADSARESLRAAGQELRRTLADPPAARRPWGGTWAWTALALAVYLVVRLIGLASYPIYFFTDEAVQTVLAADFIQAGFRDFLGHSFPTYFQNVYKFNLSLSVYAQVLPTMLFGKSIFVTRATAVLLTLPGAAAISLTLRDAFRLRFPWIGILLLSCAPAWFLHSRTAFETAMMVSFYACFLYCYLLYRTRSPGFLLPALVFAAAVFYTYGPGQIIILGTGLLLLASDARYHWQQRKTLARGLLVGLLLALPYLRFRLQLTEEPADVLRMLDSIWVTDLPLGQKLAASLGYYARGLSPAYWFFPHTHDMARHVMGAFPHVMTWTLPFVLGGIVIALRGIRRPEYRAVLACVIAIPLGGAVAGPGITRLLSMVVPATLLGAMGLDVAVGWLARRGRPRLVAAGVFLGLSLVSGALLRDALVNGPLWSRSYVMDVPWGAPQVFGAVQELVQDDPTLHVFVSPTWANGVDTLARFFLPDHAPVDIANTDRFVGQRVELNEQTVLVLTASEYEAARADPKFADVRVERLIPYPDGSPGFYFVRLRYSDQADAIFEQERLARLQPITETLVVGGDVLTIQHPLFDSGGVQHLFDGDPYTLARGYDANPMLLSIGFETPRRLTGVDLTTGSMQAGVTLRLFPAAGGDPVVYAGIYTDLPMDPTISIETPGAPEAVGRVEIEIQNLVEQGPAKIHVREIVFR